MVASYGYITNINKEVKNHKMVFVLEHELNDSRYRFHQVVENEFAFIESQVNICNRLQDTKKTPAYLIPPRPRLL